MKTLLEKAKPILFNTEMVKAILDGRKVQTRRIITVPNDYTYYTYGIDKTISSKTFNKTVAIFNTPKHSWINLVSPMREYFASKYNVGDILWVRESAIVIDYDVQPDRHNIQIKYQFKSDGEIRILHDIPERFIEVGDPNTLPNWIKLHKGVPNGCIKEMARIFLKVTNVRVERLQDISKEDAIKEGIKRAIFGADGWYNYMNHENFFATDKEYEFLGRKFDGAVMSFLTLIASIYGEDFMQSNPYFFVYDFEVLEVK